MHTLEEWQQWYQSVSVIEPPPRVPHRPSEEPLLEAWDNRLAAQHVYFDMCVAKQIGRARVADAKSIASLRIDQVVIVAAEHLKSHFTPFHTTSCRL